jgi:hypothetical protein
VTLKEPEVLLADTEDRHLRAEARQGRVSRKPEYLWGIAQAAGLGHVLGYPRISVIELGGPGSAGLLAMQRFAKVLEHVGISIEVHGFDSGVPGRPTSIVRNPGGWEQLTRTCQSWSDTCKPIRVTGVPGDEEAWRFAARI